MTDNMIETCLCLRPYSASDKNASKIRPESFNKSDNNKKNKTKERFVKNDDNT